MLKLDREPFEKRYRAKLDAVGVRGVTELIRGLASDQDAVLLCYEDVRQDGVWCHRQMFAAWWYEQTEAVVSEL